MRPFTWGALSIVLAFAIAAAAQACSSNDAPAADSTKAPGDDGSDAGDDAQRGPQAPTGAPCVDPTDCGKDRTCFTVDKQKHTWPGGYCSSACRPDKNDPTTSLNPDCPGGNATCAGGTLVGFCLVACGNGNPACSRPDQYSCFQEGCLPTKGFSECDPSKPRACPEGPVNAPAGSPDGGYPASCVPLGPDPVGECHVGCDVFKQDCPKTRAGEVETCIAETFFGEFVCVVPSGTGTEGAPCVNLNGCAPGWVCHTERDSSRVCRQFCGGPKNVACPAGQICEDLSVSVPKSTIGRCGNP